MKKLFTLLSGLCLLLAGCNDEYDDSALVKRMDDFEQRLAALERLCNDMNTNLGSMQTIVTALDSGDYITSVDPLTENGTVVGYTIRFAKGKPIVVYNGKDGESGKTPAIAVKQDADGIYYWTLDGQWLVGADGKKLPVSGADAVAPELKIEEGYWYVSYDGVNWTQLGKATGEDGKDASGITVDMDENYVYFTLPGGVTVTVPRVEGGGDDPAPATAHILYAAGQEFIPAKGYYCATLWKDGKRYQLNDGTADAFCNAICSDGNSIYTVGCEATGELVDDGYYEPYPANVATLWQCKVGDEANAVRTVLSNGKYDTSPLAVAVGNGTIYAAGFEKPADDRRAVWWKNGQMEYLTDGTTDAMAYCILADGDDVYVGGYLQPAGNKSGGIARIWKNGTAQDLTDGTTLAKVNALCMDNGVLYAAGAEMVSGSRWKGVLWRDGEPTYFTGEVGTEVTGLYVKDGKYIIEGNKTDASGNVVTCIWTNEGEQILSSGMALCQGTALAVAGEDVYVAGSEYDMNYFTYEDIYRAHIWKNGTKLSLLETDSPENVTVWGMTCVAAAKK